MFERFKGISKIVVCMLLVGIMFIACADVTKVSAATHTLTTAQYNQAVANGFPAGYHARANDIYSAFVTEALPLLRSNGVFERLTNFNAFLVFCQTMGENQNMDPNSKFGRAFYYEISNHSGHTGATCISEMKGMADVLMNRAIGNYGGFGRNYLSQFDGESMFNGISMKNWSAWPSVVRNCIRDAAGGGSRGYRAIVMAFALGQIRHTEYVRTALQGVPVEAGVSFSAIPKLKFPCKLIKNGLESGI